MELYNYILTNVRANKFIFNKEYMEDALKLYEKAKKINKGKKKYNDIFIYDIEIPDSLTCVLEKEELETNYNEKHKIENMKEYEKELKANNVIEVKEVKEIKKEKIENLEKEFF